MTMERSFFNIFEDLDDFSNMSYYLKKHEEELMEKPELAAGVPSHQHIAIDGKAVRAAAKKLKMEISLM